MLGEPNEKVAVKGLEVPPKEKEGVKVEEEEEEVEGNSDDCSQPHTHSHRHSPDAVSPMPLGGVSSSPSTAGLTDGAGPPNVKP